MVIEPMLTDQWYVRAGTLAEPAVARLKTVISSSFLSRPKTCTSLDAGHSRLVYLPSALWGHRIPAWYDNDGNVYVGRNLLVKHANNNLAPVVVLRQDDDVLDTWFSSALWTFGTQGWPEQTDDLKTFHLQDVLVTGFDIIFFWVALHDHDDHALQQR
ncbi:class I tRNA ligase family protein [Vibrio chagasii]|nr:class I tRNA ligase family protein [Vibrio chagasii]